MCFLNHNLKKSYCQGYWQPAADSIFLWSPDPAISGEERGDTLSGSTLRSEARVTAERIKSEREQAEAFQYDWREETPLSLPLLSLVSYNKLSTQTVYCLCHYLTLQVNCFWLILFKFSWTRKQDTLLMSKSCSLGFILLLIVFKTAFEIWKVLSSPQSRPVCNFI